MYSFNTRFLNFMSGIVCPLGAALGFDEFSEHLINSSCSFAPDDPYMQGTHGFARSASEGSRLMHWTDRQAVGCSPNLLSATQGRGANESCNSKVASIWRRYCAERRAISSPLGSKLNTSSDSQPV